MSEWEAAGRLAGHGLGTIVDVVADMHDAIGGRVESSLPPGASHIVGLQRAHAARVYRRVGAAHRRIPTALGQVAEHAETIRDYIREAMANAEQGLRPPQPSREVELPDELVEALASDPELSQAFDALTPGRQKSWAFQIGGAKQAKTRADRAAKAREKIMAGKGALER